MSDETLIYGTRAVIEAIQSGKELEKIFIQQKLNNPLLNELKTLLKIKPSPNSYNVILMSV